MDADAWDERYRASDYVWTTEPNRFLPGLVDGLRPGRAVDLACGEGRNAVWLATQGWDVTGVDISSVGLEKAARLASDAGVTCSWVLGDATTWQPDRAVDLVVVLYLQLPADQRRAALRGAAAALAPGGSLVVVAHDLENLIHGVGGPQDASVLYTPDDVVADLAGGGTPVVVGRAERLRRPVRTDDGDREAIDCCVVARRPDDDPVGA